MDGRRFDDWTMLRRASGTRRAALRALVIAGVVAMSTVLGPRTEAAGGCKKAGEKCSKDQQCCCQQCKGRGKKHKKCQKCPPGPGTCPAGKDLCSHTFMGICNGNLGCHCWTTTAGETRCGSDDGIGSCDDCVNDTDCVDLGFGAGAFCAQSTDPEHCRCRLGHGFCMRRCPS